MVSFLCKQCKKVLDLGPGSENVYDGDLCMMCREENGETNFTEAEKQMLMFEKYMFEKNQEKNYQE